jgi:two-component system phosphate regulon sensor histidine kinase PhoR
MAKKKKLLWHLFFSYLFITIICLIAVTWYASSSSRSFFLKNMKSDLKERSVLMSEQFRAHLDPVDKREIDRICKDLGYSVSTRFTVILPSGIVVGDSVEDPSRMDNHLDRPEVIAALNDGLGVSERYSPTVGVKLLYVAIPLRQSGRTLAVVRTSVPFDEVEGAVRTIQMRILLAGLIIGAIGVVLSFFLSHRIRRPIEEIKRGAQCFARGDLQCRVPVSPVEEIGSLSETMNQMAAQLQERIHTMTQQKNELEAVLSSMVEGVFGVDREERVIGMNPAAGRILGCDRSQVQGRSMQEVLRHSDLQRFVQQALSSGERVEKDITLYSQDERILLGLGTPLRDGEGQRIGALIVLNDVTRLRKLENIRRDFVANVSHELKTPITAIKGFVETLREGPDRSPEEADRFLQIVDKHVERLEAIVEDLLSLSRIEGEEERGGIGLEYHPVKDVLLAAAQAVQLKADSKNIPLRISCGEQVKAKINAPLFEQAVVNLLDNAVKYSEPGKEVHVDVEDGETVILIHVHDQGCGIERKHVDRLFERFYRVDKARSRKLGGTGLGLAIVKHIMQVHGGSVSVKSRPGLGSTFTLHLRGVASNQP